MDKEIFMAGDFFEDFQPESLEQLQKKYDMDYIRRINEKAISKPPHTLNKQAETMHQGNQ